MQSNPFSRVVGWYFFYLIKFQGTILLAKNGDPDQTTRSVASGLGCVLFACIPPSILYWTSDYHKFFNCLNPLKLMRNTSLKIREHSRNFVVLHVSGRID